MIDPQTLFINGPVQLTQSQVKVLDFLCQQTEQVVFMTAGEVARKLDVSDATVVRLAQTLGFDGYSQMRRHLRARFMSHQDPPSRMARVVDKVDSVSDVLASVMRADADNITRTLEMVPPETFVQVVNLIREAREVSVLGLRMGSPAARFLSSALRYLGRRVNLLLLPSLGEIWSEVSLLEPDSPLVAISLPRHSALTISLVQQAKENGVKIVAITDSSLSPLAALADHLLPVAYRLESFVESYAAVMSLMNALVTGVAYLEGSKSLERLRSLERLWEEKGIHYKVNT